MRFDIVFCMFGSNRLLRASVLFQGWFLRWWSQQWAQELWPGLWNFPWCQWAQLTDTRATSGSWRQSNYQKGLTWTSLLIQVTPQVGAAFIWHLLSKKFLTSTYHWCSKAHSLIYFFVKLKHYVIWIITPFVAIHLFLNQMYIFLKLINQKSKHHKSAHPHSHVKWTRTMFCVQ